MATKEIQALIHDPELRPLLFEQRRVSQPDGTETTVEAPRNFMRARLRRERIAEAEELESALRDPFAKKHLTNPEVLRRRAMAPRRMDSWSSDPDKATED